MYQANEKNHITENKKTSTLFDNIVVVSIHTLNQKIVAYSKEEVAAIKNNDEFQGPANGHSGIAMASVLDSPFVVFPSKNNDSKKANELLKNNIRNNGLLVITGHGNISANYIKDNSRAISYPIDEIVETLGIGLKEADHINILLMICHGATISDENSSAQKLGLAFAQKKISSTVIASTEGISRFGTDAIQNDRITFGKFEHNVKIGIQKPNDLRIFKTQVSQNNDGKFDLSFDVEEPRESIQLFKSGISLNLNQPTIEQEKKLSPDNFVTKTVFPKVINSIKDSRKFAHPQVNEDIKNYITDIINSEIQLKYVDHTNYFTVVDKQQTIKQKTNIILNNIYAQDILFQDESSSLEDQKQYPTSIALNNIIKLGMEEFDTQFENKISALHEASEDKTAFDNAEKKPRAIAHDQYNEMYEIIKEKIENALCFKNINQYSTQNAQNEKENIEYNIKQNIQQYLNQNKILFLGEDGMPNLVKNTPTTQEKQQILDIIPNNFEQYFQYKLKKSETNHSITLAHDIIKDFLFNSLFLIFQETNFWEESNKFSVEENPENFLKFFDENGLKSFFEAAQAFLDKKKDENSKQYSKILPFIGGLFNGNIIDIINEDNKKTLKDFVNFAEKSSSRNKHIAYFLLTISILALAISVTPFIAPKIAIPFIRKLCALSATQQLFTFAFGAILGGLGYIKPTFFSSSRIEAVSKGISRVLVKMQEIAELGHKLVQLEKKKQDLKCIMPAV